MPPTSTIVIGLALVALLVVVLREQTKSPAAPDGELQDGSGAMESPAGTGGADGDWDVYFCRVDDGPASILIDLSLAERSPLKDADTLYAIQIAMHDPGEHGMGSAEEADSLNPAASRIGAAAADLGLRSVGRLRNNGVWQLTFMGPSAMEEKLVQKAREALTSTKHRFESVAQADPEWKYYREFLFPSPERMRWIQDRRVVQQLQENGDPLTTARRVDHWIYFRSAEERSAFLAAVGEEGFGWEEETETPLGERAFGVLVHRVDSVEHEAIHEVVMLLVALAEDHDGDYDGWGTSVER